MTALHRSRPALVVVIGLALAAVIAAAVGAPAADAATVMLLAGLASIAASVVGAVVLRSMRTKPVRVQALVVAFSSLCATVVGVLVAAATMFISSHDLGMLVVVLVVSAAVSVGAALQLGEEVGTGTRKVSDLARGLADGDIVDDEAMSGPGELTALARELADVSRRLEQSRQRERSLESARRELIAWVSHDLRSPLATVRAMAEALDDGVVEDGAAVARYHHQIRVDAERLSVLVDDLFELSRITSGALRLDRRVSLTDVVADALAGATAHAEVKGVVLVDHIGALPAIDVSAAELTRVLRNLLDNAIRHTPAGGRVVVDSVTDQGATALSITDQCGGIPEPDLTRVFDVAFRGDVARSRDERGGGLGLAIAKGLVEAHEGSIHVDNLDDGCRFTVRLPVQAA